MARNPSLRTCKSKPLSCSSLMARSFRMHGRLCQFSGCFFVRDIFSGAEKRARKVRWKSWYTIYSCGCLSLLAWVWLDTLASWTVEWSGYRELIDNGLHVTMHTMVFLRVCMNYLCMLSGSAKLVSIYERASAYENRTGMKPCECCSTRKMFWSDAGRCCVWLVYAVMTTWAERQGLHETKDALARTFYWVMTVPLTLFWLVYDTMYSVSLKTSSQALCQYLDHQLEALTVVTANHFVCFDRDADMARRVEEVRLNVFAVLQLKRDINGIWAWSIVVSSVFALVVPCICVYEACYAAYDPEQRYATVFYTAYVAYELVTLVQASQSLIDRVAKLKDACRTVRSTLEAALRYEIQRLHDSIDPDDMALEGADFFTLKMSLLVSMAASVITYAVILQQTAQSLKNSPDTVA